MEVDWITIKQTHLRFWPKQEYMQAQRMQSLDSDSNRLDWDCNQLHPFGISTQGLVCYTICHHAPSGELPDHYFSINQSVVKGHLPNSKRKQHQTDTR